MKKILLSLICILLICGSAFAQEKAWRYKKHATDCTSLTGGKESDLCYQESTQEIYKCVPSAGDCDTAGEWKLTSGGVSGQTLNYVPKASGTKTLTPSVIIDNGGNIGVDTATPATKLDVNGATTIRGTGSSVLFNNGKSINGDTASQLTFNSDLEIDGGKIYSFGAAGLTKTSTNNNGQIVIRKTGGYSLGTAGLSVIGTDNFGGTIVMAQDTNAALTSGKYLGQLLFTGSYDVGTHNLQNGGAAIFGISTGTWSATANPSKLTFEMGDGSNFYRLQRMQITPTGTTIGTSNTTISALLSVGDSAPTKNYVDGTNDIIAKDSIEANGDMYARGNVIAYTNLGIGTPSPSTQLHVVGNARITGLVSCDTIDTDANGVLACGTDAGGGAGAPTDATYITQTPNGTLSNEQSLSSLPDGIMRVANTTGVITSLGDVLPVANGGTGASSASITAFNNITGLSASGTTGTTTTNLVFSTSPTFITPTLGAASATSVACTNGINIGSTLTYTAGNTTGSVINITPNSLTSGNGYYVSSSSNSMTGNLYNGVYTGTSSGKVANFQIINASASGDVVRIYNLGTGNSLRIEDETTADSTPFVVDASGNVGVKTSAPGKDLDVTGEIRASSSITSTATSDIGWSIQTGANTACNTTCTNACVHGWDTSSGEIAVSCSDATADKCLCAGAS